MRYPQQAEVVRVGKARFRARSDARNAALKAELLTQLLNAAFDVLHHDTAEGGAGGAYERATLRKKFARILKIKE
jgi:hypothetical protein